MNIAASPQLAAAVTNAGGLGVWGGVFYTPKMFRSKLKETKIRLGLLRLGRLGFPAGSLIVLAVFGSSTIAWYCLNPSVSWSLTKQPYDSNWRSWRRIWRIQMLPLVWTFCLLASLVIIIRTTCCQALFCCFIDGSFSYNKSAGDFRSTCKGCLKLVPALVLRTTTTPRVPLGLKGQSDLSWYKIQNMSQ